MCQSAIKNWLRHADIHPANAWSHLQAPIVCRMAYEYATRSEPLTLSPIIPLMTAAA
jgi:hypothetical protein